MPTLQFDTPDAAEMAFYQAFAHVDLELMMQVWADDPAVVCVHPPGMRLCGRVAIEQGWRELFGSGVPMRFRIVNGHRLRGELLAVHSVIEEIHHGPQLRQRARMVATNAYRRFDDGWRMVLHHGSPGETVEIPEEEPPHTGTLH